MSTSQRVSRGFHRLALFLAAIPLLIGSAISIYMAVDSVNTAKQWDEKYRSQSEDWRAKLLCGQDAIYKKYYADMPRDVFDRKVNEKLGLDADNSVLPPSVTPGPWDKFRTTFDLKYLGCSASSEIVSAREIYSGFPSRLKFDWPHVLVAGLASRSPSRLPFTA